MTIDDNLKVERVEVKDVRVPEQLIQSSSPFIVIGLVQSGSGQFCYFDFLQDDKM